MTLTGIELRFLVNEITGKTEDYYVSNIYGMSSNSFFFKLHHPKKQDIMLMFTTFGLWITSLKLNQVEQKDMLRRLRNNLLRTKLTKIEQIGAERIAYLTFSGYEQDFILVGEFFGDGNIILCNKDMKILALLHSLDVRHRKLRIGLTYQPPPQNSLNIFEVTSETFEEILSYSGTVGRWIGRNLGLPSKYVEEICKLAKIDPQKNGKSVSSKDIERLFTAVKSLTDKIVEGKHDPRIIKDKQELDVFPLALGKIGSQDYTKVSSFMEGLDTVFTKKIVSQQKSAQTISLDKKITELENELEEQTKAISLVNERSGAISNIANLLLKQTEKGILSINDPRITKMLGTKKSSTIKEKGKFLIIIGSQKIQINPDSSLHAIISTLFSESKKQSSAIKSIESMKKKTQKKLERLCQQSITTQDSVTYSEIRVKEWYERYRWFYTSDGLLAIGGRDASSNSSVIRKHLEKNDKVFHAEIFGSPFFILKNCSGVSLASLRETAKATVCFSRAWKEGMYGLSSYWVNPEQIKKAAPSGQFLPKGSFVIEGQRNFIKIPSMQLGIGLLKKDGNHSITCGPAECIKKNSIFYVVIEPDGMEMAEIAKKIRFEFLKAQAIESVVKSISVDDFVRALPAGKSHIVKTGKGDIHS